MLKAILDSAGLNADSCASALGVDPRVFNEWITGQRPLPPFIVPQLTSVLGVKPETLLGTRRTSSTSSGDLAPAIWFKLRGDNLGEADRENILLIRRVGFYLHQLQQATNSPSVLWQSLFASINAKVDRQAPPREQGRDAARMFRAALELSHGAEGIGQLLRNVVRRIGVLVIESPVSESHLEGCAFYVGEPGSETPCIFINSYKSTWFRRNLVLGHELGHAAFDIGNDAVSLDFFEGDSADSFRENRAQAFAQELLVPLEVIRHVAQTNGFHWDRLSEDDIAKLVARTHVEKNVVVDAAKEAGFISDADAERYKSFYIADALKQYTTHALPTDEYISATGISRADAWSLKKRTTTLTPRRLRLPVGYIKKVIDAARAEEISYGKAAEMLMIDKSSFIERFGNLIEGSR